MASRQEKPKHKGHKELQKAEGLTVVLKEIYDELLETVSSRRVDPPSHWWHKKSTRVITRVDPQVHGVGSMNFHDDPFQTIKFYNTRLAKTGAGRCTLEGGHMRPISRTMVYCFFANWVTESPQGDLIS